VASIVCRMEPNRNLTEKLKDEHEKSEHSPVIRDGRLCWELGMICRRGKGTFKPEVRVVRWMVRAVRILKMSK